VNPSRRKFTHALALAAVAAPLAPEAISQDKQASSDFVDVQMKVMDVHVSDARASQIREFLLKTTSREISVLRAWPVRRDLPPALMLGVFDS
jgi:hypothetical protein